MSLNKTLDRLFDEIRREAKRNQGFADRLDAVLRAHVSRRDVDEDVLASENEAPNSSPVHGGGPERSEGEGDGSSPLNLAPLDSSPARGGAKKPPIDLNPVGLYQREGEEALAAALDAQDRAALLALVDEHNLDPGGEASELDRDALAAHVLAQAKRRAERDSKLFDY